jgi:hypothetical protein
MICPGSAADAAIGRAVQIVAIMLAANASLSRVFNCVSYVITQTSARHFIEAVEGKQRKSMPDGVPIAVGIRRPPRACRILWS